MNDSYAATRIHVMRTKLITSGEYERLLKMSDTEVIAYLQGTEYRDDVNALAVKDLEDLEMIDRILSRNGARTMEKLQRIASKNFMPALTNVLHDNDRWNLKIAASGIAGAADLSGALLRYGRKGTIDHDELARAKSLADLATIGAEQFPELRKKPETLAAFLEVLAVNSAPTPTIDAERAIIDERNILRIVRSIREGIKPAIIVERIMPGGTLRHSILRAAANAPTVEAAFLALKDTAYGSVIAKTLNALDKESLVRFEHDLHKSIVRTIKRSTRRYPLHVEMLLHFLAEKETEHENIRLLVKGKRLGLDDEFIREHLVA